MRHFRNQVVFPFKPKLFRCSTQVYWILCQTIEINGFGAVKSLHYFLWSLIWCMTFVTTADVQSHSNFPLKPNLPRLMTRRQQWLTVSDYYLNGGFLVFTLCPLKDRPAINTKTCRCLLFQPSLFSDCLYSGNSLLLTAWVTTNYALRKFAELHVRTRMALCDDGTAEERSEGLIVEQSAAHQTRLFRGGSSHW